MRWLTDWLNDLLISEIPDSLSWIPDSKGFRIPKEKVSWIPGSTSKKFPGLQKLPTWGIQLLVDYLYTAAMASMQGSI